MNRRETRARWRDRIRSVSQAGALIGDGGVHSADVRWRKPDVTVRIEEMRFRSFPPGDARKIADALQQQLTALLIADGPPPAWLKARFIERAKTKPIRVGTGHQPAVLGEKIAHALKHLGEVEERR